MGKGKTKQKIHSKKKKKTNKRKGVSLKCNVNLHYTASRCPYCSAAALGPAVKFNTISTWGKKKKEKNTQHKSKNKRKKKQKKKTHTVRA